MTTHTIQSKVAGDFLQFSRITENDILRDLALKLVKNMPMHHIENLFNFKKIDPNDEDSLAKIESLETSDSEKNQIMELRRERVILYEAEINIPL